VSNAITRSTWRRKALITLGILALLYIPVLIWWLFFYTYHLETVHEGVLYRDGMDRMPQFKTAVRKSGAKTVVCLVDQQEIHREPFVSEVKWLASKGVKLEWIPVNSVPSSADVQRFLDIATQKENQPVLVHCRHGVDRTAMMTAAYQESVLGYTDSQAVAAILTFGRGTDSRLHKAIEAFIADYDGPTRTLKSETATSN
jgi:protein tyrosine/serine phosphatase